MPTWIAPASSVTIVRPRDTPRSDARKSSAASPSARTRAGPSRATSATSRGVRPALDVRRTQVAADQDVPQDGDFDSLVPAVEIVRRVGLRQPQPLHLRD